MNQRVEAAAQAYNHASTGADDWNESDRWTTEDRTIRLGEMSHALTAADAVMFSEAAIERAAQVLWDREMQAPWSSVADGFKKPFINEARAVVAALREEA